MKILAFGASNSRNSINKKLAIFTAKEIDRAELRILDLNDFEMPIFSADREAETGIPKLAHDFKEATKWADGIVVSFAEHNGAYSTAFKNIFDWVSRIEKSFWNDKPLFLLATSPGARGGKSVLDIAFKRFSYGYEPIIAVFSLPSFYANFKEEEGILDSELDTSFRNELAKFISGIS
ncbi:MAG: chromate reductase [Arcticibacterium sp.]|jgi:chromate reductase